MSNPYEPCNIGPEPLGQCCDVELKREEPSVLARLEYRRKKLVDELETVDAALAVLEKNPEIGDALTKIGRAIGRL